MIGVILVNVGTPDAPRAPEVRRYLRQFLGDPRVLDINPVGRWLLLNLIILPTRPAKSAEAYRQIWTDEGSPLLVHGRAFEQGLQQSLGDGWLVKLAHRYGSPSVDDALDAMWQSGVERVVVFPMYPQYASSSTGTSLEAVYEAAAKRWAVPALGSVAAFYDDDGFVDATLEVARPTLDEAKPDYVLFSYHGLPERHVTKCDPTGSHCLKSESCCDAIVDANRSCYRAQSYANARTMAERLGLEDGTWSVAFQSRLGRTPWIRPYTDEVVQDLAKQGVKRLAVFVSSFVADCLETLEEIGIRAKEDFEAHGGESLHLIPCVNSHPSWIEAAAALARRAAGESAAQ